MEKQEGSSATSTDLMETTNVTPTERFSAALAFATRLHAAQLRKGTAIPYISHLLAVCAIVLQHGGTEDEAIAALLHDAVEDQGGAPTLREIDHLFGGAVSEIIEGCTDADAIPKPPWRGRKEKYLAHLLTAPHSVRLVCAADKLDNARSILADYRVLGEALWSRFNGGKEGTLWYYRAVVEVLKVDQTPLVEELNRVVSEIETLAGNADRVESERYRLDENEARIARR